MGSSEAFCLRWNDYHSSITSGFCDIRGTSQLLDTTIRCGSTALQAHRLILSSCSLWFREIFSSLPSAVHNPVIVIWDACPEDLKMIFDFMYNGEVNVKQDNLNSFLALAERLQVQGLTQDNNRPQTTGGKLAASGEQAVTGGKRPPPASQPTAAASSQSSIHRAVGLHANNSSCPSSAAVGGATKMPPAAGDGSLSLAGSGHRKRRRSGGGGVVDGSHVEGEERRYDEEEEEEVQEIQTVTSGVKEEGGDYQEYQEQQGSEMVEYEGEERLGEGGGDNMYDSYYELQGDGINPYPGLGLAGEGRNLTNQETAKGMPTHGGTCPICFKFIGTNVRRHVEDLHCPTSTPCTVCGKVFTSNNKMRSHKAYAHRGIS